MLVLESSNMSTPPQEHNFVLIFNIQNELFNKLCSYSSTVIQELHIKKTSSVSAIYNLGSSGHFHIPICTQ